MPLSASAHSLRPRQLHSARCFEALSTRLSLSLSRSLCLSFSIYRKVPPPIHGFSDSLPISLLQNLDPHYTTHTGQSPEHQRALSRFRVSAQLQRLLLSRCQRRLILIRKFPVCAFQTGLFPAHTILGMKIDTEDSFPFFSSLIFLTFFCCCCIQCG